MYKKAYLDPDFMNREEVRHIRIQTELLRPTLIMDDEHIQSTVCVFGSARTPTPTTAQANYNKAKNDLEDNPDNEDYKKAFKHAETQVENSKWYAMAREFSALMSKVGQRTGAMEYVICTGGGPGIMEAANRGASDVDAESIGLNITLPHEQTHNDYISPNLNFLFHYFSIRKMHFLLRAKALCAFPGGFGTMDELFETLTLIQTDKSTRIPVILFGKKFWEELIDWDVFVKWGMISPEDMDLFIYCEDPDDAVQHILDFYK